MSTIQMELFATETDLNAVSDVQPSADTFTPENQQEATQAEKKRYTMTEKAIQAKQKLIKTFELSPVNHAYMEAFKNGRYPKLETDKKEKASYAQYKCTIGAFLEHVKKDAVIVKIEEFESFFAQYGNETTKANKQAHVKSFLSYIIRKNVSNCQTRASRETLITVVVLGKE